MNNIESEQHDGNRNSVPFLTKGIGTRITEASVSVGGKRELSKLIDISEPQLHRIISGESQAKVETIAQIAAAAGVSLAWLVAGEEGEPGRDVQEARAPYAAAAPLHIGHLTDSIMVVEELLEEKRLYLQPPKKAQLVAIIYEELLKEEGDIKKERVLNLVKLAV